MLYDLTDVSFLIPFKKDSDERVRNLNFVLSYLGKYFKTNIFIIEHDTQQNFSLDNTIIGENKIDYQFIKSENYIFHRTKLLNLMAKKSKTQFICLYDLDVVFKIQQYLKCVEALRANVCDMVFPYSGPFINYNGEILNKILQEVSVESVLESEGGNYNPNSVGGAIFFNKQKFIECGMENEHFISWGFEDLCRVSRNGKLGMRIARVDGILYHLNHPVSDNSSNTKHGAYNTNHQEYAKVANMSPDELRRYVNTWAWIK